MNSFSLPPAAPTPIRLAQIYVCETITYYDMLWFGLESNSNSNLANTLFTACFWQMNWAFSETMPNALLPLGWMLKTKLTLLCLVLLLVSHDFFLYCFLFYFVDSVFFFLCVSVRCFTKICYFLSVVLSKILVYMSFILK